MTVGLMPKHLVWIVPKRLAASERPGGQGKVHRRVRRDEELAWIRRSSITRVLSLLGSSHNLDAYAAAGIPAGHIPIDHPSQTIERLPEIYAYLDEVLASPDEVVLVHLDDFNETLSGVLAGYLVHAKMVPSGPVAVALIERITGQPMTPEGREIAFATQTSH
jgi:hypothetical protein